MAAEKRAAIYRAAIVGTWLLGCCSNPSIAQNVEHNNTLELIQNKENRFILSFGLNLPQVLHGALAPNEKYPEFLQRLSEMQDSAFALEIERFKKTLNAKPVLITQTGQTIHIHRWELPNLSRIRDILRISVLLLKMPPGPLTHLDPIPIIAYTTKLKQKSARLQVQMHRSLHPIFITFKSDKFWLTNQIPYTILDVGTQ